MVEGRRGEEEAKESEMTIERCLYKMGTWRMLENRGLQRPLSLQ